MPRYFFDLLDQGRCSPDAFGDDFENLDAARQHAPAILADLVRDELPDGEDRVFGCDIRDEAGRVVFCGRLTYRGQRVSEVDGAGQRPRAAPAAEPEGAKLPAMSRVT